MTLRRPHGVFRAMAAVALTVVVATAAGALGAGGTYAFLNAAAPAVPTATLTAGTASLSVTPGAQDLSNISPGQTRTALFTLTNVGDVRMDLAISSIAGPASSNGLTATVSAGSCTATQYTSGAFGVSTLAKGASTTVCVTVQMLLNAPNSAQNASTPITVLITGTQA